MKIRIGKITALGIRKKIQSKYPKISRRAHEKGGGQSVTGPSSHGLVGGMADVGSGLDHSAEESAGQRGQPLRRR